MEQSVDHICGPRQMKAYMDRVMAPKLEELGLVPSSAPFICEIARMTEHLEGRSHSAGVDLQTALHVLQGIDVGVAVLAQCIDD